MKKLRGTEFGLPADDGVVKVRLIRFVHRRTLVDWRALGRRQDAAQFIGGRANLSDRIAPICSQRQSDLNHLPNIKYPPSRDAVKERGDQAELNVLTRRTMITSLILAAACSTAIAIQTPGQPVPTVPDYIAKYEIADPNRLALTPRLDGKFDEEEWDLLHASTDLPTYMQWEPNALYIGGNAPSGKDVVISLDLRGDGWLVGNDNLEVRVSWADGAPVTTARILDANNRNSPIWVYAPMTEKLISSAGTEKEGRWNFEAKIQTVDLPSFVLGRTIGIRTDLIDKGASTGEPFTPRACAVAALRYDRSRGLPSGMEWAPEYKVRSVTPGEGFKLRQTFTNHGQTQFRRVEMRSEGFAREATKLVAQPFPSFDKKGRSYVDFESGVSGDASVGYRLLRTQISGTGNADTVIQSSFLIANTVSFEPVFPMDLMMTADSRIVRGHVTLRSHTTNKVEGNLTIVVPSTWSVTKGATKRFSIYHSRGTMKIPIELIAPQREQGLIPIQFKAQIGNKTITDTAYVPIR